MIFNPPEISLSVFAAKSSPARLLVKDASFYCQKKQVSVTCFGFFFFDYKSVYISKAWVTCHIQGSVQCGNFISFYFLS